MIDWKVVSDSEVVHVWEPVCGCNVEDAEVNPDFYENNGTPVCSECGEDMTYSRTLIGISLAEK